MQDSPSSTAAYLRRTPGFRTRAILLMVHTWMAVASAAGQSGAIRFEDVTANTGITFRHCDGSSGLYRIAEGVSSGLALLDYDSDGDVDIYLLSGAYAQDVKPSDTPINQLYRNEGNWRFTDVTQAAGVGDTGFSLGVTTGDYDNDGDQDIYVNNYGPNVLYRNNGDGTFTDVTQKAGVAHGDRMGAGANFLDIEGDGDLDLFVSSYVIYSPDTYIPKATGGFPVYPGPGIYEFTFEALYRNNGDGTFSDISKASGIAFQQSPGMGSTCADFDNDGDTDIFTANDTQANYLYENDGAGHFTEIGLLTGVAYDLHGQTQGSMGMELADYDNDGWLDLCVTSYQNEWASLLHNLGDGIFEDVTLTSGMGNGTVQKVTWGVGCVDFDNDGLRDLFVACGHIQANVESFDDRSTYHQKNVLYRNLGKGKLKDVSKQGGNGLEVQLASRGAGFDDMDNDGDVDVVILNSRREPTMLRNDSPDQGHWLQVTLQGTRTNRDGVGAQVRLMVSDATWMDEVHSGRGYQSDYGRRLHFGLGTYSQINGIEVRWIGGVRERFPITKVDHHVVLVEGKGLARPSKEK